MTNLSTAAPWLSVLIPVYNVAPYLRDCIASVIAQVSDSVEIMLYEDVSTDGSRALLEQLQTEYAGRLSILWGEQNVGLSGARNAMIDCARGEYLWLLDSDDLLAPDAIAGLASTVDRYRPELVICDFVVLNERQRLKDRWRRWRRGASAPQCATFAGPAETLLTDPSALLLGLYTGGSLQTQLFIAHRDVWSRNIRFPLARYFEDQATTPGLLLRAKSVWYAQQPWYCYRKRGDSITATMSGRKLDDCSLAMLDSATHVKQRVKPEALSESAKAAIALFHARSYIGIARRVSRTRDADRHRRLTELHKRFLAALPMATSDLLRVSLRQRGFRKWLQLKWRLRYPLH